MENVRMNRSKKFILAYLGLRLILSATAFGELKLPKLVSDGMVLQRDADVQIWGWAAPDEKVSVEFLGSEYSTTADVDGDWQIVLSNLPAGGPYDMQISSGEIITLHDILVGDVWVCSGQSNMELPISRVIWNYADELNNYNNPNIRQFYVPQKYDFKAPRRDLEYGYWAAATPANLPKFSAVAFFFAKELYDRYQVPVGLINASLGGSPAQAWMSEEALKGFPEYYQEAMKFRDDDLIRQIETADNARISDWYKRLRQNDQGYADPQNIWYSPNLKTAGWATMKIPGYWKGTDLEGVNGVVWFRRTFKVPDSMISQESLLILGRIIDADSVFVNGRFVGTVSYQYPPRRYPIPAGLLKAGDNTIVVRLISNIGEAGFVPDKDYEVVCGAQKVDLQGEWQYKIGAKMEPLQGQTFVRWKPLGLYNAMLAPLLKYRIRGVIWYQGESNTGRAEEYQSLFPALIADWRRAWNQSDFPFLFVQLPNFMEAQDQPSDGNWAVFRESQMKTLAVPNTAMAVAIDAGEWNDIHPLNKKIVGQRLALAARKIAYGEDIVFSGPVYRSMRIDGNRIILTFDNIGSGLVAKGGELKQFAIAGADKKFVWANAKIEGSKIIVWSDKINQPVAVRYAWAENPAGANLYNQEGLPASPFRTDGN